MSELMNLVEFGGAALVGKAAHGVKKMVEMDIPFKAWFMSRPERTLASLSTTLIAIGTVMVTGTLDTMTQTVMIGTGLLTGYAADSVMNRAAQK
jgi:hypothetical protein